MVFLNICEYGVAPNKESVQTQAIQKAIDIARAEGKGVYFPEGIYTTGTLNISSVSINLEKGAVVRASTDINDYVTNGYFHNEMGETLSLMYSFDSCDVSIFGEGTIDLQGDSFYDMNKLAYNDTLLPMNEKQREECCGICEKRPNQPIFFYRAKNVTIHGITVTNAPCWTMSFVECENIRVYDMNIFGHPKVPNNDGMHFCSCRDIFVTRCNIDTADDCIALSSITDWNLPCENVVISDCILKSFSKALSIGYMHSIVRNVTVTNCHIRESNRGISIMSSAGSGIVENITFSNLTIDTRVRAGNWWGNGEPIFIMTTHHHNYVREMPRGDVKYSVRNILFSNIICHAENAIGLIGVDNNISDVTFRDVIVYLKESDNISLKGRVFDVAPSQPCETIPNDGRDYVFVSRNAVNLTFENVYGYDINGNKAFTFVEGEKL